MKKIAIAVALTMISSAALADTCKGSAAEKKLAGAALTSFMKKCESDAQKSCDASAVTMKLAGAAKTSHVKKCMTDTVGN